MTTDRTYELLDRLGNLLRREERLAGAGSSLQPVHLQALWYLSRANRYSDTPGAVARYLGITDGTASSTLKVLRGRGLLATDPDPADRRVSHLRLTPAGHAMLVEGLPPPLLSEALGRLGGVEREGLERGLEALLRSLQGAGGGRAFGVCHTCRHFRRGSGGYLCGLTLEALAVEETGSLCIEHDTGAPTPR